MPLKESIETVGEKVVRFKTTKFGVTVYRQRFTRNGEHKYTRAFYVSKTVAGKLTRFPVGSDVRMAERNAEEIIGYLTVGANTMDKAVAIYNPSKAERMGCPTFQDILDAYKSALNIIGRKGGRVSDATYSGYRSSLAYLIRKVESYRKDKPFVSLLGQHNVDYSPWFGQRIDVLTTKYAMDFKLASVPADEEDEEVILTSKISCDSTLRSARAFFSKNAMRYYTQLKLKMPDISGFMSEPDFGAKKYFQLLPASVIVDVMRASIALRNDDLDAFRAFLLCMHCGLRRAEALAFATSWLREEDRPMMLVTVNGVFNPKHGTGRKVALEPWVSKTLHELGPVQASESLDRLNDWVKGIIPAEYAVTKPLHELRKCWVSCKAKTDGILAAAQQAGHRDTKTTVAHYADNMLPDRLTGLWSEPAEAAILKFA